MSRPGSPAAAPAPEIPVTSARGIAGLKPSEMREGQVYAPSIGLSGVGTTDTNYAGLIDANNRRYRNDANYRQQLLAMSRNAPSFGRQVAEKQAMDQRRAEMFERQKAMAGLGSYAGHGPAMAQEQYRGLLEQQARPGREQQAWDRAMQMQELKNQPGMAAALAEAGRTLTGDQRSQIEYDKMSYQERARRSGEISSQLSAIFRQDPTATAESNQNVARLLDEQRQIWGGGQQAQGKSGAVEGDLNGDGKVSAEESEYNQAVAVLKSGKLSPADEKRIRDRIKQLESDKRLFPNTPTAK